jgi:hypothetical protein
MGWDWDDGFWLEVGLSGGLLGTNRRWLISCLTFGGPLGTRFFVLGVGLSGGSWGLSRWGLIRV